MKKEQGTLPVRICTRIIPVRGRKKPMTSSYLSCKELEMLVTCHALAVHFPRAPLPFVGVVIAATSLLWTLGDGWQHGSHQLSETVTQMSC